MRIVLYVRRKGSQIFGGLLNLIAARPPLFCVALRKTSYMLLGWSDKLALPNVMFSNFDSRMPGWRRASIIPSLSAFSVPVFVHRSWDGNPRVLEARTA